MDSGEATDAQSDQIAGFEPPGCGGPGDDARRRQHGSGRREAAAEATPTPSPTPTAPPSGGGSASVVTAPTGTLEPSGEYLNVDVTVTCPVGWTLHGNLYVRQADPGGAGNFSVACMGTSQVGRARVVKGNRFTLGNATATAYVTIARGALRTSA
jgi:hypothetical protein